MNFSPPSNTHFYQTRWALFFSHFNFTLICRTGSRNVKPGAHCLFFLGESSSLPYRILPPKRVIVQLTWGIESVFWETQQHQPDPGNGTTNRAFVLDFVHSHFLQWAIITISPLVSLILKVRQQSSPLLTILLKWLILSICSNSLLYLSLPFN